jgi:molybdopterin/thiamine biosynthesis adenylyltransferase
MKEIIAGIESYKMKKLQVDTEDLNELKNILCKEFELEPELTTIRQLDNKKEIAVPPKEKDFGNLYELYAEQIEGLQEDDRGKNFEYFVLDYLWARELLIYGEDFKRIKQIKILLVGAGALGNEIAKNLALSGVGTMTIVDRDTIETPNLSKSIFFRESDIGSPKAQVLAERVQEMVPTICVDYFIGDVTSEYIQCKKCGDIFELQTQCPFCDQPFDTFNNHERVFSFLNLLSYDLVVSCVDNFSTREYLTRRCIEFGIPYFDVGISGKRYDDDLEGNYIQIRNMLSPEDPCIGCLLSEDQIELFRDPQNGADPCGLIEKDPSSLSLMSIAASIQSEQILNFVTGTGKVLSSLFINTTTNTYRVNSVSKNTECLMCSPVHKPQIKYVDNLEEVRLKGEFIQFRNRISLAKEDGSRTIYEVKENGNSKS